MLVTWLWFFVCKAAPPRSIADVVGLAAAGLVSKSLMKYCSMLHGAIGQGSGEGLHRGRMAADTNANNIKKGKTLLC